MEFDRYYIVEVTAFATVSDEKPIWGCRLIVTTTHIHQDSRSADEIVESAAAKGFEVTYMNDYIDYGAAGKSIKARCERLMVPQLERLDPKPNWVHFEFKARIYVPRSK